MTVWATRFESFVWPIERNYTEGTDIVFFYLGLHFFKIFTHSEKITFTRRESIHRAIFQESGVIRLQSKFVSVGTRWWSSVTSRIANDKVDNFDHLLQISLHYEHAYPFQQYLFLPILRDITSLTLKMDSKIGPNLHQLSKIAYSLWH